MIEIRCDECRRVFDGGEVYCPDCMNKLKSENDTLGEQIDQLRDQIAELKNLLEESKNEK